MKEKRKGKILINVNDIIGKRLGKLKVECYVGHRYDSTKAGIKMRHYYACSCECGKFTIVRRCSLITDSTHSCGCECHKKRQNKRGGEPLANTYEK